MLFADDRESSNVDFNLGLVVFGGFVQSPTAVAVARQSQEGTDGAGVVVTLQFIVTAAAPDDLDALETDDLTFALGQGGVFLEDSANREIVVVDVQNGDVDKNGCGLLGDFDNDCDIDIEIVDFNLLVGAFGSSDARTDIYCWVSGRKNQGAKAV